MKILGLPSRGNVRKEKDMERRSAVSYEEWFYLPTLTCLSPLLISTEVTSLILTACPFKLYTLGFLLRATFDFIGALSLTLMLIIFCMLTTVMESVPLFV